MKTVFNNNHLIIDDHSKNKEQALAFIAQNAASLGYVADADLYHAGLLDREKNSSTGLMGGMATPHCKNAAVKHAGIFVVRFKHAIEWQTMDEAPVNTAVALTIPAEGAETSIRMLTKLSRRMMRIAFRETLQQGDIKQVESVIADAIA
ncbi:PTS sugar transporter subunit IIA [Psychromonas aquimarina]|uniref:PTS sugar transporter subunit IIA n=1 Tax=Psychromonas aquimarina TaxID=444919 RepID=UPI0004117B40|nr:fructose PTS transporter subunit IIA [Psychromonas aquimarina]